MHNIEPFYSWRHLYIASEDQRSPLFGREYSETECVNSVYNYFIHPEWDDFGSATLYLKILYTDYKIGYSIIELLGEWNDCLYNDIMYLKRNIAESLLNEGVNKFILIGENILNFHADDDSYYQEWFDELDEGWIACVNFRNLVLAEIQHGRLDYYLATGGKLDDINWRTLTPDRFYLLVNTLITKRLNA